MKKTAIAIALAALLSACATGQKDLPVSSLRFDYVTSGGRELGLVRAFDDGAHTALQFNVDLPRELQVFDAKGQPLAYQQVGQTAVLPGLYSPLRVQIGQREAPKDPPPRQPPPHPTPDTRTPEQVLGLVTGYTQDDLKTAYRRESQKLHPDKWAGKPEAIQQAMEAEFKAVQQAYKQLKKQ